MLGFTEFLVGQRALLVHYIEPKYLVENIPSKVHNSLIFPLYPDKFIESPCILPR